MAHKMHVNGVLTGIPSRKSAFENWMKILNTSLCGVLS